jgi:hypothetical protein
VKHYDGIERRSQALPYRLYRFFGRRGWGVSWPLLLAASMVGLVISLAGAAELQPPIMPTAESGATAIWVICVAVSVIVGILAVIAGISKLAEPVARKVVGEHDGHAQAHGGLTAIGELRRQNEESAKRHAHLGSQIAVLSTQIKYGFENLPCKHDRGYQRPATQGCPTPNNDDEGDLR